MNVFSALGCCESTLENAQKVARRPERFEKARLNQSCIDPNLTPSPGEWCTVRGAETWLLKSGGKAGGD